MDFNLEPIKTVSGNEVRNLKKQLGSECNCSLSQTLLIGQILVNSTWHETKWNLDGTNVSGVERWRLNISNAADFTSGNI